MKSEQLIDWLDLFIKSGKEFTLAFGQKSSVYVDIKKTTFHHAALIDFEDLYL